MRVKSKWHKKDRPKTAEEVGNAIAFIAWRVAANGVMRLLGSEFDMETEERRFAVLSEFLAFLLQAADRMAHAKMDDEMRHRFVNAVGKHMAITLEDNKRDRLGAGDYQSEFIALLNDRSEGYAELTFTDGEPGYSALIYLGDRIQVLVDEKDFRWMKEQIIDVEAPEAVKYLKKSWNDLFSVDVV